MLEHSWVVDEWVQAGIRKGLEQGLERGLEKGLEQGRKEGREEAQEEVRTETLRQTTITLLRERFEVMPLDLLQTLNNISQPAALEQILHVAIRAQNLDDFRRKLALMLGE